MKKSAINKNAENLEKATFAAGCFWGVEAAFQKIKGVISTRVGYTGGDKKNPSYEEVCTGKTGHAEAVEVVFDSSKVTYDTLLNFFWDMHDPTTFNRQGLDVGSQYRSAIFYHNDKQKAISLISKKKIQKSGRYTKDIVTEIMPASEFYFAEDFHQNYLKKNGYID